MDDLAERLEVLGGALARCPAAEEISQSEFMGVRLSDMTRDQLMQVIWLLGKAGRPATNVVIL